MFLLICLLFLPRKELLPLFILLDLLMPFVHERISPVIGIQQHIIFHFDILIVQKELFFVEMLHDLKVLHTLGIHFVLRFVN